MKPVKEQLSDLKLVSYLIRTMDQLKLRRNSTKYLAAIPTIPARHTSCLRARTVRTELLGPYFSENFACINIVST